MNKIKTKFNKVLDRYCMWATEHPVLNAFIGGVLEATLMLAVDLLRLRML